jgi:hypothetical protein
VVKFFIFLIVIVFDPLAIALIIAFNGLIGVKKKKQRDILTEMMENDQKLGLYEVYGDKKEKTPILASKRDAEVFFDEVNNPSEPNEALVEAVEQYEAKAEEKKKETDSDSTNLEEVTLTDEEKAALEPEITDEILMNLQTDYSKRAIDYDGDGTVDGYDTDGDGIIDIVRAEHPSRAAAIKNMLPYYAKDTFNWDDRKNWINDQNAVNYWIQNIKPSQYPTDFSGKSY